MAVKVLAADIGFTATGMVVFELQPGKADVFHTACAHTSPEHKKRGIYVAHDDVRRTAQMVREIMRVYADNSCKGLICELPAAGAQNAKASRGMGIATGMIATMVEFMRCPAEWITPQESRKAAIGVCAAPKGEEIKKLVMAAMEKRYPVLTGMKAKDKEHIADALATFEAAKDRQMVRTLESI